MKTLLYIESGYSAIVPGRYRRIKELGYRLVVARQDLGEHPEEASFVDDLIPVFPNNYEGIDDVVESIVRYCRQHPVDGVTTRWDAGVPTVAAVAERLGLEAFSVNAARLLRDKYLMREALAEWGVPSARYQAVRSAQEAIKAAAEIGYPVVMKPTMSSASWGVIRADSAADLEKAFPLVWEVTSDVCKQDIVLVEEYLDGPEFSVETVVFQGEPLFSSITLKPLPMNGDRGFAEIEFLSPAPFSPQDADGIKGVVRELVHQLGVRAAVLHTEMRLTRSGPRILEVHPRVGGYRIPNITDLASGVNLEAAATHVAVGVRPDINICQNGYAAFRNVVPKSDGHFDAVLNREAALAIPGVVSIEVLASPGELIRTVPHSWQSNVAIIIAHGSVPDELLRTLEQAERALDIQMKL